MPALNFQKQFAPDVKSGKKKQTIRSVRKNPIKADDTLYLYTGMRTKQCEKIKEVKCVWTMPFSIPYGGLSCTIGEDSFHYLDHLNNIAVADGFDDWIEMVRWFSKTHSLPFSGTLIKWD